MNWTIGSLFSGIGGLELGLERAGLGRVVFQCEIDPFCRAVLAKHWPNATRYEDVRSIDESAHRVDVLCGGFPCQDVSVAGKGAGLDGDRSGLWFEFARVIRVLRPRVVVAENVAALLGRGIDRVLGDLSSLGYDAEWSTLRASDVGAPHLRDRVFIVALRRDVADADGERLEGTEPQRERNGELQLDRDSGSEVVVADADELGRGTSGSNDERQPVAAVSGEVGVADAERGEGTDASRGSIGHGSDARRIEASGGTSGSGEAIGVADATSSRRAEPRRLRLIDGGRSESADRGEGRMADADSGRREVVGLAQPGGEQSARGSLADGSGAARRLDDRPPWDDELVADTAGVGLDGGTNLESAGTRDVAQLGGEEDVADAERDAVRQLAERDQREGRGVRETECGNAVARDDSEEGGGIAQPVVGGSVDGISDRMDRWPAGPDEEPYEWEPPRALPKGRHPNRAARLKALGNAVVPQVAEAVGFVVKRLIEEWRADWLRAA